MAHPKHKVSSTRRDKRRTHYKAVVPTVVICSNCGAATLYHRVCPECGFYRGKLAIEKKAAEECIREAALFLIYASTCLCVCGRPACDRMPAGRGGT